MKRLLLLIALCLCTTNLSAEGRVFCEIIEYLVHGGSTKVMIDFGQEMKRLSRQTLVDENGEPIIFNSKIDALNYMESLGWTFLQVYTKDDSDGTDYIHWLLYKEIHDGVNPYEGLYTEESTQK